MVMKNALPYGESPASGSYKERIANSIREALSGARGLLQQGFEKMPQAKNVGKTAKALGGLGMDIVRKKVDAAMKELNSSDVLADVNIEVLDEGKKLVVWLVHPTNYRQDGTPRKWEKQILPTNAIGQLTALMPDKLDDDTEEGIPIKVNFLEDTVQDFDPEEILASMDGEEEKGVVMLSGVQTNQWERALDLASLCQERGIPVVAGGYHVRADLPITKEQAKEYGISLAIGEAESLIDGKPFLDTILQDVWNDNLQAEYRQKENPVIGQERISRVIPEYQELMINPAMATMESSRGCPLPCSFCTIRTIGGTTVRARDPESMKDWLRHAHDEQGIRTIFITDDNFSKSKSKFEILTALRQLKEEGRPFNEMIQVDTMATIGNQGKEFVEACKEAGVHSVFLGIESVDPEVLKTMNKPQNKPERYKPMIDAWHEANIMTQCGFILGNEGETPGVGKRSAEALLTMGVDVAAAYVRTPLPGSVDYHTLHEQGLITDADFNSYDSHSKPLIHFPNGLSPEQLMEEYDSFYQNFFAYRNMPKMAERLSGHTHASALRQWIWYKYSIGNGDHPMYSGWKRRDPDYLRSDFARNRSHLKVEDLAPHPDGPGSPKREKASMRDKEKRRRLMVL